VREEELDGGHSLLDRIGCQLSIAEQVELELPDVVRPESIGRTLEVLGELP
jgi:hypothetical protein